jgi:GxxExxY protein
MRRWRSFTEGGRIPPRKDAKKYTLRAQRLCNRFCALALLLLSYIMTENALSYKVIGVALEMHKHLGPGLLESAYESALAHDLVEHGFEVRQQVPMPFIYKAVKMDVGYRMDLVINDKLVIEIKSVEELAPVHYAQVLTYLKLSGLKLGLLMNFNTAVLKDGIHRVVNKL